MRTTKRNPWEVSTHSRPKAAGQAASHPLVAFTFQLTAARRRLDGIAFFDTRYRLVSTHSRPKAAGDKQSGWVRFEIVSTHSRPKAAG